MDKQIEFQNLVATTFEYSPERKSHKKAGSFDNVFNSYYQQTDVDKGDSSVLIGTISENHPTVSDLLINHEEFGDDGWDIIFSAENKDKPYTKIPTGTPIYYDPENNELSWSSLTTPSQANPTPLLAINDKNSLDLSTEGKEDNQTSRLSDSIDKAGTIELGIIDTAHPTLSHLLSSNPQLADKTWDILAAPANTEKDFTKIPTGAVASLDLDTEEISWFVPAQMSDEAINTADSSSTKDYARDKLQAMSTSAHLLASTINRDNRLSLGEISKEQPTVSHLLKNHSELESSTWSILDQPINQEKSFHTLMEGTEIFVDTTSMEISWGSYKNSVAQEDSKSIPAQQDASKGDISNLTDAVQPFMGTPYEEIDCYTLLINGLKEMGIPYGGKDGLYGRLTQMAKEKGLPTNAFLNGEGIVEAAGKRVISQSFLRINNWTEEADKIFRQMEPHLAKGQILSFSTPSRGHTGIVSQYEDQWTFINSGQMDNHVEQPTSPKEVGEENLLNEIANWFKLANRNRESLQVTLGQLEEEKIRSVFSPSLKVANRL